MINEHLHNLFFEDPLIKSRMPDVRAAVLAGVISPSQAVSELIKLFEEDHSMESRHPL